MVSDTANPPIRQIRIVLILVVMEYGLRQENYVRIQMPLVLILVVMEYGLRPHRLGSIKATEAGLNPCCNGIWSQTKATQTFILKTICLNPCCNGIWSQTVSSYICPS